MLIIVYFEWFKIILNIFSDYYLRDFKFLEMLFSLLDFDIENLFKFGNDIFLNNIYSIIEYLIYCVYVCFLV